MLPRVTSDVPGMGLSMAVALAVLLGARALTTGAPIVDVANADGTPPEASASVEAARSDGITFGRPVVVSKDGMGAVLVLVSNTTDEVKSFTIKASLSRANATVAQLAGAVNDLRPHEMRAADLMAFDGLPATYDRIDLSIDQVVTSTTSARAADVAAKLKLGAPSIASADGSGRIRVPVTNDDVQPHSFTVRATFLSDGDLVGDAVGDVGDLGPGQTSQVTLLPLGDTTSYDQVLVAIDSVAS